MVISLSSVRATLFLILFALIPISFILLAFNINPSSTGVAYGQEVIETTTTENTLTPDLSPVQEQQKEQQQQEQSNSDSIVLTDIERLELVERAGDAAQESNYLKMSATGGDEECCQVIQYTPGPIGVAGITFKGEQAFDLSGAKRVVFFAKGQQGGENLRFLAAGITTGNTSLNEQTSGPLPPFSNGTSQPSSALLTSPADIFQGKNFGRITENLILDTDWNRYQISIEGIDLAGITDPFGFIMANTNGSGSSSTFSLKGVSYDTKVATDPVDTLEENSTTSSIPSNSTTSSIPSNSTTSSIPSNSTTSSIPSNSTTSSIPSNSTTSSIPSNSTKSYPPITPPQSSDNSTIVDRNSNATQDSTSINTNNQDPALNQNLTQQPFDITTATSFSAPNTNVSQPFGAQIAASDLLDYSSAENESIVTNENVALNYSTVGAGFSASNGYGEISSSDLSPINSNNHTVETVPDGDSIPAISSLPPNNQVVYNSSQVPPGVSQLDSVGLSDLGGNSNGQYLRGTESKQSSVPNTKIDTPALYQNTSSSLTFGPVATNNPNGRESTSDQQQSAPFSTSSTPETFAIDNSPISQPPASFFPSPLLATTPQPSLLPPEAFNPTTSDAISPDIVTPSVIDSTTGLTIQNGGAIDSSSIASDTIAPDTQILSAVDSNNAAVLNGSSTSQSSSSSASPIDYQLATPGSTANSITFSFAATDDSNIIAGYECRSYSSSSLQEEIAFVPCTSPTVTEIPLESSTISTESGTGPDATYLFQVRATDTAGNVDPSPATFQWTNTPTTGTTDTGIATPTQQDPLLQQQLPQDPLLQQQLPQDPLLQQQLPQDPLLQQQLPQDPLLQQQLQPGVTIQGPFPGTGQFGQIPQQQSTLQLTEGQIQQGPIDQNALPSPVILPTPTQQLPSLPSGTTIYGSSNNGLSGIFDTDQSGYGVHTGSVHNTAPSAYN